ncbi:MAG: hypothetical protein MHPSP_001693, partial [Paramarteilia canceri]
KFAQITEKNISKDAKYQVKVAQTGLVAGAMVPFKIFKNESFINFCDVLDKIGAKYGNVLSKEFLFSRQVILQRL